VLTRHSCHSLTTRLRTGHNNRIIDFVSVILTPKYAQLDSDLTLYSSDTTIVEGAEIIHDHDQEIVFKMTSSFSYTAVTLKMIVSPTTMPRSDTTITTGSITIGLRGDFKNV
jgi:hypothetical protein